MNFMQEYKHWLNSPHISKTDREELEAISGDEKEIESRFCGYLGFGTAGLRGIMAVGTNNMNVYVVRHTTQAFAEVILHEGEAAARQGIAISFDCRNHSREFAREAACVMAANGINVRLFAEMRPTPELSFAIRHYCCTAGINITASHNPKEYNGYKVYWSDGAQLPPEHAKAIAEKMSQINVFESIKYISYDEAVNRGLINIMGKETDELFLQNVMGQMHEQDAVKNAAETFKMVFTPFHGTGRELIPEVLHRLGLRHVYCVDEQMVPDGNFSTVKSPNPENPEGFLLSIALADKIGADFILGSDPDADRVGIMVRGKDGKFVPITGNQTGALMLDYLIGALNRHNAMPENPAAIKTIVSTEMVRTIAERNNVRCFDTFTGFKFIAEKKNVMEGAGDGKVIFAFEESYGYMLGDYVRDKDAVTASLVLSEMAAWYSLKGMTLIDALDSLYEKYGTYCERTLNLIMPGLDGAQKMKALMDNLRSTPPSDISGEKVSLYRDYLTGTETAVETGAVNSMELSGSNVLSFVLSDNTVILVRPSGTEPKVKVYVLARGSDHADCAVKLARYSAWAETLRK